MRLIRSAEYRRMAWKNGGGETMEIALAPPGAALDQFDWRISVARVAADGAFSPFPGIDRTLAIIEGGGIRLVIDGSAPLVLAADSAPIAFPGDVAASAALIAGPVTDLNVMTRRGRFAHAMTRRRIDAPSDLAVAADIALLLCVAGRAQVATPGGTVDLDPRDSLLADDRERGRWRIVPERPCSLMLIEIGFVLPRPDGEREGPVASRREGEGDAPLSSHVPE